MNIIIMNNLIKFLKLIFYFLNTILIILYLFPGSIFGYFLYNDLNIQPQITRDFIISSNHFYAFALLSIFGFFAYHKTKNINFLSLYLKFRYMPLYKSEISVPNHHSPKILNLFALIICFKDFSVYRCV